MRAEIETYFRKYGVATGLTIICVAIVIGIISWGLWKRNSYIGPDKDEAAEIFRLAKEQVASANYDSALNLYSSVAFAPIGDKSIELRQRQGAAYNNIGYVLFYGKQDQLNAYPFFLKALRIANESNHQQLLPYIWLNIANIKADVSREEALEAFRDAFTAAVGIGDREIANIAYSNLINLAIAEGRLPDVKREMDLFASLPPRDTVELTDFSRLTHEGALSMTRKDYGEAARLFMLSADSIKVGLTPGRYRLQSLGNAATALIENGDTSEAISTLNELEQAAFMESTPEVRCDAYKMLDRLYTGRGDKNSALSYKLRHLELSDSLYNFRHGYALKNVESQCEMDVMNDRYAQLGRRHDRIRIITWAILVGLIGIMVFTVITFLQKRKSESLLRSLYLQHRKLLEAESMPMEKSGVSDLPPTVDPISLETVQTESETGNESEKTKYKGSSLSETDQKIYVSRIVDVALNSPEIFNMGFSIERLSALSGIRAKIVSQVINETWHMNFNAWLNTYRCREAALRLADPAYSSLTIESIAEGLGFRNRSHFAAVFKSSTGMSPAEYRRASKMTK